MLEDVYIVDEEIISIGEDEINTFQLKNNIDLPNGYISYLLKFGLGTFCGFVNVHRPSEIKSYTCELIDALENKRWKNKNEEARVKELRSPIQLAETLDCDRIFYVSGEYPGYYVLPRHDNRLYTLNIDFSDPCAWYVENEQVRQAHEFRYFEPSQSQATVEIIYQSTDLIRPQIEDLVVECFESEVIKSSYNDHTLLFIREISGTVELTFGGRSGGVRVESNPKNEDKVEESIIRIFKKECFKNIRYFSF